MFIFPKGFLKKVDLLAHGQSITLEFGGEKYGLTRTNMRKNNATPGHNYFIQRYFSGIYSSYIDVVNPSTVERAISEILVKEIHET